MTTTSTPQHAAPAPQDRKVPLILKVYGLLCLVDGIVTIPMIAIFAAMVAWTLQTDPSLIIIGTDPTLPVVLTVLSVVVTGCPAHPARHPRRALRHRGPVASPGARA